MPSNTWFYRLLASCRIALMLVLCAAVPAMAQEAPEALKRSAPKPMPVIEYTNASGRTLKLTDEKAPFTIVHFWATWCVPCVKEIAELDQVAGKYAEDGLRVVAISMDGSNIDKVRKFYAANKIVYLSAHLDKDMNAFRAAEINGLPSTIFVDAGGNEVARSEGVINWHDTSVDALIIHGLGKR